MVKAPVKASPGIRNIQPHTAYQQQYPTPSVFIKVQHIDMNNDTPSTSTGITNVSVVAVPTTSRVATTSATPLWREGGTFETCVETRRDFREVTKINQPQPTHVAPPPPPRLALHHIHPMGAPMQMQHGPGPWPIVDPVFHFGPGFEHQHYCPTHSQGPQPHEHVVFFHVNAGVSVTFQIAGNREVIRGKFHSLD